MNKELELKKFNLDKIIKNINEGSHAPIIYVSGIRQSGKTFFINHLLSHIQCTIINFSDENYNPRRGTDLDVPKLEKIMNIQKNKMRDRNRNLREGTPEERILLNFDHVVFETNTFSQENIKTLFMSGRHLLTSAIFSFQYPVHMSPECFINCDYVFIFGGSSNWSKKKLYEYFFKIFDKFKDFETVLNECTKNNGCLVLDQTIRANKIEDCIFWYKVEEVEDFEKVEKIEVKEVENTCNIV